MVYYLVDISSSTHLVRSMPLSEYGWQDVDGRGAPFLHTTTQGSLPNFRLVQKVVIKQTT
jgi:hypothetical protein